MTSFTMPFGLSSTKLRKKCRQTYWNGWELALHWTGDISNIKCEKKCSKI